MKQKQANSGTVLADRLDQSPTRLRQLFESVLEITSELQLPVLLHRVVEVAVALVDCRFGALGILGTGEELAEFVTVGLDPHQRDRIGPSPIGRGVLGKLISTGEPIRLTDIAKHPSSYGFPPGHPIMTSFLGVPVRVHTEIFGNLYLTEKNGGGDFTDDDEQLLLALAAAAGMAIENARLYTEADLHRRWLEAAATISNALFSGEDPDTVLPMIAAQAREHSQATTAVIAFVNNSTGHPDTLVVESVDSLLPTSLLGVRIPLRGSLLGHALDTGQPSTTARAVEGSARLSRAEYEAFGPSVTAVPLGSKSNNHQDQAVLAVIGSEGGPHFTNSTLPLLNAFAAQAALALETARSRRDAQRLVVFEDRDRIARDLHDLVIQRLFASGMYLENTAKLIEDSGIAGRLDSVVNDLDQTIHEIRATIFELKSQPHLSKNTDLRDSIFEIAAGYTEQFGFMPSIQFTNKTGVELSTSITTDLLMVIRETLSNAARHATASQVQVIIELRPDWIQLQVIDDGVGFTEPDSRSGLLNLQERAAAHSGEFSIGSGPHGGTVVNWSVPQ